MDTIKIKDLRKAELKIREFIDDAGEDYAVRAEEVVRAVNKIVWKLRYVAVESWVAFPEAEKVEEALAALSKAAVEHVETRCRRDLTEGAKARLAREHFVQGAAKWAIDKLDAVQLAVAASFAALLYRSAVGRWIDADSFRNHDLYEVNEEIAAFAARYAGAAGAAGEEAVANA